MTAALLAAFAFLFWTVQGRWDVGVAAAVLVAAMYALAGLATRKRV